MDQHEYEALREKIMETYSVLPTLFHPEVKRTVDWHCLVNACLNEQHVFTRRDKWIRHHKIHHNPLKDVSDREYPGEVEAKRFVKEHYVRELARHQSANAAACEPADLMPPNAPLAIPNPGAPAGRGRGRPRKVQDHQLQGNVNKPARRREDHQASKNETATLQVDVEAEHCGTSDSVQQELMMWQIRNNCQTISRLNRENEQILERLAENKRPRDQPCKDAQEYPATPVANPIPTWGAKRAPDSPRRAKRTQAGQSRFARPADPNEGPADPVLDINYMTPSKLEEMEEGEDYTAASHSDRTVSRDSHDDDYQAVPDAQDDSEDDFIFVFDTYDPEGRSEGLAG